MRWKIASGAHGIWRCSKKNMATDGMIVSSDMIRRMGSNITTG